MRSRVILFALTLTACGGGGLFSGFGDGDGDGDAEKKAGPETSAGGGGPTISPFGGGGADSGASVEPTCNPNLTGLVRDFRGSDDPGGHPDFQAFSGSDPTRGLVAFELGPDKKPVFASTTGDGAQGRQLTGKAEFDQWYRNVDGVNRAFEFELPLQAGPDGIATFSSNAFFPIDNKGFGNSGNDDQGAEHNFHFTFELHMEFVYRGGETFTFSGDDDLWTFFNGKLGIDLGGLHPARSATVKLDDVAGQLGLTKGNKYPLDVFHAERSRSSSNFRIDTTLEFVNCGAIIVPK